MLARTFKTVYRLYGKILFLAALISGIATFIIMWLIALSALLRTVFNAPIPASVEISQALLVLCITFPLGYTLMKREHVRTVAFSHRFPAGVQRAIYALWMVLGCLVFAAATLGTFRYGMRSYQVNEMVWGAAIQFPLWPSKLAVSVGCGLLTIQFALEAIGTILDSKFMPVENDSLDTNSNESSRVNHV
ncbi:TRAP transporter small permease [Halomonas sp. MCCC 1A11036]|uniref:TRAP transporter small permease protein n=1 Tax=Billgrantia zhangzhouensis TaxID=2733481 RepID=A0ABS9AI51_9GAMM|nr:TRAP transporter small permease [Halomonas zhangzhouensis]MCE8021461.1 TRAP transporter small permease [Halomonas zhangzhouensis]